MTQAILLKDSEAKVDHSSIRLTEVFLMGGHPKRGERSRSQVDQICKWYGRPRCQDLWALSTHFLVYLQNRACIKP